MSDVLMKCKYCKGWFDQKLVDVFTNVSDKDDKFYLCSNCDDEFFEDERVDKDPNVIRLNP